MRRTEVTRLALLRSAERLFASRGVDAVSLREIAADAGQRNHSAALYHFGDKRELLEQLLHRHSGPIDEALVRSLAPPAKRRTLPALVKMLCRPLVAKLDDADGGADYVTICAELASNKTFPITSLRAANGPGASELSRQVAAQVRVAPMLMPLRMMRVATTLFGSLSAYLRMREAGLLLTPADFEADLVASLVALLRA